MSTARRSRGRDNTWSGAIIRSARGLESKLRVKAHHFALDELTKRWKEEEGRDGAIGGRVCVCVCVCEGSISLSLVQRKEGYEER